MTKPARGEIWLVNFDPQIGDEIKKKRPALAIQEDGFGALELVIVVPITDWKDRYSAFPWHTKLRPGPGTGLKKESSADALQVKSVSHARCIKRIGFVSSADIENVAAAVALCVGFVP
jgi:mRNA interferase MazF